MFDSHANHRGILLMVAGSAFFAANDACTKLASAHMPASQTMAVRGVMAGVLLFGVLAARGELRGMRHVFDRLVLLRAGAESAVAFLYITALAYMSLGDASAILQIAPLATMAAAVVITGVAVGWRRWVAVIAGFLGVLLVIKPGGGSFQMAALMPLAAAFLISFRDFMTGRIAAHVPTLVVTLVTAAFGMAVGFIGSGFETWRPLEMEAIGILGLAAVNLVLGHMLAISAFRGTDPALISPFRYSNVPFAVLLGALIFANVPDLVSLAGMALIVAAGVYTLHSHRLQRLAGRVGAQAALRGEA